MTLFWLWTTAAALAGCEGAETVQDLEAVLAGETPEFAAARGVVDCLEEVVPPALATQLVELSGGQPAGDEATLGLEPPAEGTLWVDGVEGVRVPLSRGYVFQRQDAEGAVVQSQWVAAGELAPSYPLATASAPPPPPEPQLDDLAPMPTWPTGVYAVERSQAAWAVAGVAALGAGVTYGLAWNRYERFYGSDVRPGQLDALRTQNNALLYTSSACGAVAIGAIVAGVTKASR